MPDFTHRPMCEPDEPESMSQDITSTAIAAHDLQRKIAGAAADIISGMGHDLPLALLPRIAAAIAGTAARVPSAAPANAA